MSAWKKLLATSAAAGAGLNVEEVFSTYLYDGTGSTQTITNGIDLSGEGGLVWGKSRTDNGVHSLYDTERGVQKPLISSSTNAQGDDSAGGSTSGLYQFNSDGFNLGSDWAGNINVSGQDMASWTFRKAPKFFDVVTYTGNGVAGRTISHNLGTTVGCVMIKNLSSAENWMVYHRGSTGTDGIDGQLNLNSTAAATDDSSQFNDTVPSSTVLTLGSNAEVNFNGDNYVAYLFAHNDGDGDFGPTGDQDIIKCGSYTGNGSTDGPEIDLGFEPQWIITKAINASGKDWNIYDSMRGFTVGSGDFRIKANTTNTESVSLTHYRPTATGFKLETTSTDHNGSGTDYIYIAIRRGPMAVPTDATDVFHVKKHTTTGFSEYTGVGFAPDMGFQRHTGSGDNTDIIDKLRGPTQTLLLNSTSAEATDTAYYLGGFLNDGVKMGTASNGQWNGWNPNMHYYWQRRPNFFDVVAYTGNGTAGRTVSHNLGVAPEMMWVKNRDSATDWQVYHSGLGTSGGEQGYLSLNTTNAAAYSNTRFYAAPTSSVFSLGSNSRVNTSGADYIAYLFASVEGVSKVGSYTGNGEIAPINVDCGFSSGARFVLIKRTDSSGDWYVYDSERGINAGGDPYLLLNSSAAETTGTDYIDPYSSGFTISDASTGTTLSVSGATYIFYAIA